jgi:hypothetical protein
VRYQIANILQLIGVVEDEQPATVRVTVRSAWITATIARSIPVAADQFRVG